MVNLSINPDESKSNLDYALRLAAKGWLVFPCGEDKKPLTKNGFKDATKDPEKIKAWSWPLIGIYCEGSGFFVVDIDVKDNINGYESWKNLVETYGGAVNVVCGPAQTTKSGGSHLIFKYPQGIKVPNNTKILGPNLDLRSAGYICTGPGYAWMDTHGLDTPLVDAPAWLLDLIRKMSAPKAKKTEYKPAAPFQQTDKVTWAAALLKRLDPWRCDNYGEWVRVGMSLSDLGGAGLQLWDDWSKGSPKYTPGECEKKWDTFKPGGLTLGSLWHWATQDDPNGGKPTAPAQVYSEPLDDTPEGYGWRQVAADRFILEKIPPEPDTPPIEGTRATPPAARPTRKTSWTVAELLSTNFPDPKWAIPGLIPVGLSFLAGRPKLGKSWLALQFAHAVGTGGRALGEYVQKGKVLYLALEDGERRLKERIIKHGIPSTAEIVFQTEWKPLPGGGLAELQNEITIGGYSFVVIDTISRALGKADQLDLTEMTTIMANLQNLALTLDISILLIDHHTKPKGFEGDPIDDIMGSTGKAAVSDVGIGLYRQQGKKGATLKARGRDMEDKELALEWDAVTCCWQSLGNAGDVREDTLKGDVLRAIRELKEDGELATTHAIAKHLGKTDSAISHALADLLNAGKVRRGEPQGKAKPYEVV